MFSAPAFHAAIPRGSPLPVDLQWVLFPFLAFTASGGSVWEAVLYDRAVGVHVHAWKSESLLYKAHTGGPGDTQSLLCGGGLCGGVCVWALGELPPVQY
jgi:hypothetical protein